MDRNNCETIYAANVLMCWYALAMGPTPGNLLVLRQDGQVTWLTLLRGLRFIIESVGREVIFSGVLAPLENEVQRPPTGGNNEANAMQWQQPLDQLSSLVSRAAALGVPGATMYYRSAALLSRCYEGTFGQATHPTSSDFGQYQVVMAWLYDMEDEFIEGLKSAEPIALTLLAYFFVLVHSLKRYWFMRGWAEHIVTTARDQLRGKSHMMLHWPLEQILEPSPSEDADSIKGHDDDANRQEPVDAHGPS